VVQDADPDRVETSVVSAVSAADEAARGRRGIWIAWVATRLFGVVLLSGAFFYPAVDQDVVKYTFWAHQLYAGHLPWRGYLVEYPPGVSLFMALPGGVATYELQFIALAMAADAAVLQLLWRGRPRGAGSWLWLFLPVALGPMVWVHLDIFVAVAIVGFVVALREGRWRTAGACLAAATLLKLWPIVLLVVLWRLIPVEGRRMVGGWAIGVVAAMTLPIVAYGGGSGLLWMLHYQGGRGLELESVWAWVAIVARAFGASVHPVTGHGGVEFQISGVVSTVATLALPLAVLGLAVYVWRDAGRRLTVASANLLAVAIVLIGSKVLSPQYVIWTLAAVAVVIDELPAGDVRRRVRLVTATLVVVTSTQLVFPFAFIDVYFGTRWGVVAATSHALSVVVWVGVVAHDVPRRQRDNQHRGSRSGAPVFRALDPMELTAGAGLKRLSGTPISTR
jgi:hypothetical protein